VVSRYHEDGRSRCTDRGRNLIKPSLCALVLVGQTAERDIASDQNGVSHTPSCALGACVIQDVSPQRFIASGEARLSSSEVNVRQVQE
jgi:hypothetical protein